MLYVTPCLDKQEREEWKHTVVVSSRAADSTKSACGGRRTLPEESQSQVWDRASNSERTACFGYPGSGIKGECHHIQLAFDFAFNNLLWFRLASDSVSSWR